VEELHLDGIQPRCSGYFSKVYKLSYPPLRSRTFQAGRCQLKRIFWLFGVGLGGFFIGGTGGGPAGGALGFIWGACIGYGFGSIFDTKQATKRLVVYWGLTTALIGIFFGLMFGVPEEPSIANETVAGAISAAVGALCGSLFGIIQLLWRLRRKPQAPNSDSVA
jgi:hypothetical protein